MKTVKFTVEQIVMAHAEIEFLEKGDRFATEEEMKMYRNDPMGMFGRREVIEIVAEWMVRNKNAQVRSIEVEDYS